MNSCLMCKIFGHKFVNAIYSSTWYSDVTDVAHLNHIICKRCGLILSFRKKSEEHTK